MSTPEMPHALLALPGLSLTPDGAPVFAEPWQAQIFGMTLQLQEKGVFSWSEWAAVLSAEIHRSGRCADGSDYYDCWLAAFQRIVCERSITSSQEIARMTERWQAAAEATPHGEPIRL